MTKPRAGARIVHFVIRRSDFIRGFEFRISDFLFRNYPPMPEIALVLLPGLHGSDVQFRPLLKHLPPRIRPVAVNYPPDELLGYEELLPRVLAALPTDSPFVLLGESF